MLNSIFSDNMMLQCEQPIIVWGIDRPNQAIEVVLYPKGISLIEDNCSLCSHFVNPALAGNRAKTDAGADGKWFITLPPLPAGQICEMKVVGSREITVKNILLGDVWLCSGQSNMGFELKDVNSAETEIASADFPEIRFFKVTPNASIEKEVEVGGTWEICTPETVKDLSAVGYFFARDIHIHQKKAIGLIRSSWGGTRIEAWMRRESLLAFDFMHKEIEIYESSLPDFSRSIAPDQSFGEGNSNSPYILFDSMIKPLLNFALKGILWYQGENNVDNYHEYKELFVMLIKDWRKCWNRDTLPFYFVQLANFVSGTDTPELSPWGEIRKAQEGALALENTAMAVAIDIGDPLDIHPANKQDVGRRLALIARAKTYGEDIEFSGPILDGVERGTNEIVVLFTHAAGLHVCDNQKLSGFKIRRDREWVDISGHIDNERVILTGDSLDTIVELSYGYGACPRCNLYNKSHLPARPFSVLC